jgi:hypothetical protein
MGGPPRLNVPKQSTKTQTASKSSRQHTAQGGYVNQFLDGLTDFEYKAFE